MVEKEFLSNYHEPEELQANPTIGPGEIVLGTFVDMDQEGRPLVDFPKNPLGQPLCAISTLSLTRQQLDRTVALLFSEGDFTRPVIMGLIHNPLLSLIESAAEGSSTSGTSSTPAKSSTPKVANVDGESVVIEGQKEVVLRCGDASITLTRSGKILIRGKYLLNRSSGVNRIMGGSVQVN